MRITLSIKLLISYFLILGLISYFLLRTVNQEVKPLVRQSAENVLVDHVNLLAAIIEENSIQGVLDVPQGMRQALEKFPQRNINAMIWGMHKNSATLHLYVTDTKGNVVYDSLNEAQGRDYSLWNDVYSTLRGHYGARTSRIEGVEPASSIMYVAAPIHDAKGQLIGVVSVGKDNASITPYIERASEKLVFYGSVLMLLCLLLGFVFVWLLSRRISRLKKYAQAVRLEEKTEQPVYHFKDEISDLAQAVTEMKVRLEGKQYIENHVQILSHEFKSPLAAIAANAEILEEEIHDPDLAKLAKNIVEQSHRLSGMTHKLLEQSRLEQQQTLEDKKAFNIYQCVAAWQQSRSALLSHRQLQCENNIDVDLTILASPWLLEKCFFNILDNALQHAEQGSTIICDLKKHAPHYEVLIFNQAQAIPDYALHKVFDKFYSLPDAQQKKKSTGLGLSFVKEALELHKATITLTNSVYNTQHGVLVALIFPL